MFLPFQFFGSAPILAAFTASQTGRMDRSSLWYLSASTIGSFALAVSALMGSQWGFLALAGAWFAVSLATLCQRLNPVARQRGDTNNPVTARHSGASLAAGRRQNKEDAWTP